MTEPLRLRADESDAGRRLDVFLAERLALSRAQVRRLLARGAVRWEGRSGPARAKGEPLRAGACIEVAAFSRPEEERPAPEAGQPLRVLAEGDGWLAVDKPAGVPVHPLREGERGTLLNALVAQRPQIFGVGEGGLRSGVVHRLDVDTSGVVLFAVRDDSWRRLRAAFAEHRVEKLYRAIVQGRLREAGSVELPLVLARHRPARVRVLDEREAGRSRAARLCEMAWRPLELHAQTTLVEVRPRQGFLHQIRASFAHLGHPLAGDRAYGGVSDGSGAERHMLHAARVVWQDVSAESPDAEDMGTVLKKLRNPGLDRSV